MDTQIVAVLCLFDDLLKALHHFEDRQCVMSDGDVLTTAVIVSLHFGDNYTQARWLMASHRYMLRR